MSIATYSEGQTVVSKSAGRVACSVNLRLIQKCAAVGWRQNVSAHQSNGAGLFTRAVTRKPDPPFLVPPVQIYRNIWTPRIIYFNFAEIFGPPGTKISEIFGPS